MRKYLTIVSLVLCLTAALFISTSKGQYDWPMHGYNPACTSYSPSTAPNSNTTAWITDLLGGTVWAYPVVAEGKVFIGAGGYLNAFDENTGGHLWSFRAPDQPGYPSPVATADGRVFFGTAEPGPEGCIYALNTTTGEQIWNFTTEGFVNTPVVVGDRIYFGCNLDGNTGKAYCLNATSGVHIWNYTTQDTGVVVAVAYGKVYAGCGHWASPTKAAMYCLDMYDGSFVWKFDTGRDLGCYPSVANGKVYFSASYEGSQCVVFALNATNGNHVWNTTRYANGEAGRTAVAYGKVFVNFGYGAKGVYALNETNGDEIWAFPTSVHVGGGPVVADSKVFFGLSLGRHMFYALNETTGSVVWNYTLGGYVHSWSSAIANGRVFVADHYDPKLYAFGEPYTGTRYNLTITTTTGGTTMPPPVTHSYSDGTIVSVRATPDTGYILHHWELDGSNVGYKSPITITMNQNHTLHAVFTTEVTIDAYCYTEDVDPGVSIAMDGLPTGYTTPHIFNITGSHNFTVPNKDSSGHLFKQWNTDETSTTITVTTGGTYTGYYQAKYNLTITTTLGGTTNPPPGNYSYWEETEATVTAIPDMGYALDHWELDDSYNYSNPIIVTMDSNHTLHAVFKPTYMLTITTTTAGTTDPSPGTHIYIEGTTVTVTATPYTDSELDHWELDSSWNYSNPINVTMNADHNLHAVFIYNITVKAHCYTENVDLSVNITMDGSSTGYTTPHNFTNLIETHNFTIPNTDPSGHLFKQWNTDETSTTITVTTGGTYTGYYQAKYNLTITTTLGGTTNPPPGNYSYWEETEATVTAIPSLGYILDHWELDEIDVGAPNPISVTMNTNHTLHAVFSWVGICNLKITKTTGGTTNPALGTYSYTNGTIVTVTAIPNYYHEFDHWELDGPWKYSNPIIVTMDSNHNLHAVFIFSLPSPPPEGVGGFLISVDKFGLLVPYLGLASTIVVATVATVIYAKRLKRRKGKQ